MLTVDEYVGKRKRADKMDEFDYVKSSENMAAVMKYVMAYFNEYLTMETCDAEVIKLKNTVDKIQKSVEGNYPKSEDFIIDVYMRSRIKIHKEVEKWLDDCEYFQLLYLQSEFDKLAADFCAQYKVNGVDIKAHTVEVATLIAEIKASSTEAPTASELLHFDRSIVAWVRDTYQKYGVNLCDFAGEIAESYYHTYIKYEYDRHSQRSFHVNCYDHRYNENPFEVDRIYEDNKHRPFLENRRGELEMLLMHDWVFTWAADEEYWPEYVNLCIERGRIKTIQTINTLIPVSVSGITYPEDNLPSMEYLTSDDGTLPKAPKGEYILRINIAQTGKCALTNLEETDRLTTSLIHTFQQYGAPKMLELAVPLRTADFQEETFLTRCTLTEKKLKRFSRLKIALVNGPGQQRGKTASCISTVEEMMAYKKVFREKKLAIQFSVDFVALLGKGRGASYYSGVHFKPLAEIKNSIICLHITNVEPHIAMWPKSKELNNGTDVYYLSKYKYPVYEDFYSELGSIFNDYQQRYLIPQNVKGSLELELVLDSLTRSGFSIGKEDEVNG